VGGIEGDEEWVFLNGWGLKRCVFKWKMGNVHEVGGKRVKLNEGCEAGLGE
jgi:hypothetical protein